jgi:hypothetical protein
MKRLIVFPFVLLLVSACSLPNIFQTVEERGGDLADQAYALVAVFDVIDEAALQLAEKPDTPAQVVSTLKRLRAPARAAMPLIAEAAKSFRAVRNRLDDLENPSTVEELTAVVTTLGGRMDTYAPVVRNFISYVDSL